MGQPGKRAPTAEICNSDKEFEPLAMRQHALGAYPLDPNLISQGVPLDDRVNAGDQIYGPVEGTPPPPGQQPRDASPPAPPAQDAPSPSDTPGATPPAAPSAFTTNESAHTPPVAVAKYDPHTGRYVGMDGHVYQQSDLATQDTPRSWKDLVLTTQT
jgi:hypothetical protein